MITAKKATPSIRAADTIMLERISPLASGWRAIASMALAPILPIPIPAPIAANPAPKRRQPLVAIQLKLLIT